MAAITFSVGINNSNYRPITFLLNQLDILVDDPFH